jgi:talin
MASALSLKISLEGGRVTKTIQFDPNTTVFDACRIIRDKFADAVQGQGEFYILYTNLAVSNLGSPKKLF